MDEEDDDIDWGNTDFEYHDEDEEEITMTAIQKSNTGLKCFSGDPIVMIGHHRFDDYMIAMMHKMNEMASGINFFVAARDKFGSIGLYPRVEQPCMGEFRKYKDKNDCDPHAVAHGDLAHGSKKKPTDLFCPFPSGEPVAFGTSFCHSVKNNDVNRWLFSNDSPWKDAFGDEKAVEFTTTKAGQIYGVVIKTTDIDPSVFVHLVWNHYQLVSSIPFWVDRGFTRREGALISCLTTYSDSYNPLQNFDVRRFLTQDPVHILPMTFRKGADYARSSMPTEMFGAEGCWRNPNGGGFNFFDNKVQAAMTTARKTDQQNAFWRETIDSYMETKMEKAA